MFAIKEKFNHDSIWMKFIADGKEIKLFIGRRGESITYSPVHRDVAKQIWADFQNMPEGVNYKEQFARLRAKYEAK